MALLPPTANTTIITRQLLLTPDDLRGRLSGVLGIVTGVAAARPALGGVLASAVSGTRGAGVRGRHRGHRSGGDLSPTLRSSPATSRRQSLRGKTELGRNGPGP